MTTEVAHRRAARPLVFVDDAHSLGGAQIAMAWAVRTIIRNTEHRVVCVCPDRTREVIENIVGSSERIGFVCCPRALPLNIMTFPLRILPWVRILRSLKKEGVLAWWLNLSGIEFALAPLVILKTTGERHGAWLHCAERFTQLFEGGSWTRRLLSRGRDFIANKLLFRLHPVLATPSRGSSDVLRKRLGIETLPPHLYPTMSLVDSRVPTGEPGRPARAIRLWMIGRVEFGCKNNGAALEAFRVLKERGLPTTLTVIGDGPDLAHLQVLARRLKNSDGIVFSGWQKDPWLGVHQDDVVLIPSLHEGMPLVAIEAMLRGVRLVTSPLPMFHEGIPEGFIAKGFSGELLADQVEHVCGLGTDEVLRQYSQSLAKFSEAQFMKTFAALSDCVAGGDSSVFSGDLCSLIE